MRTGLTRLAAFVVSIGMLGCSAEDGARDAHAGSGGAGGGGATGGGSADSGAGNSGGLGGQGGSGTGGAASGGAGGVPPDVFEDFNSYPDTSTFLGSASDSDHGGLYNTGEDFYGNLSGKNNGAGSIEIDASLGYGSSPQSMRYTWYATGPKQGGTISRQLALPGGSAQQVWVEVVVRFSDDFKISNGYSGGAAYKFVHVNVSGTSGRFGVGFENGDSGSMSIEAPDGSAPSYDDAHASNGSYGVRDYFTDGAWHVVRYHASPTGHSLWVDGTPVAQKAGLTQAYSDLYAVSLGKNINMQPLTAQQLWWGQVSIWVDANDPGW